MSNSNLNILEEGIKQGEDIYIFRIFFQNSRECKRVVVRNDEDFKKITGPLRDLLKVIRSEMTLSRKLVDVRNISEELSMPSRIITEVLRPKLRLIVFGAGHVGQAVCLIGSLLGFDVLVIDDRPEFASRERLPDSRIKIIVGDYAKVVTGLGLKRNCAVVIVTRGHQFDEICLRGVVRDDVGYLGMIGSKRRVISVIDRLERDGYSRSEFEKLHAPIGLQIGAKSPQEIAVAILAEVISHFSSKKLEQE